MPDGATELSRIKVDFHTHTSHSHDATLSPSELVDRARAAGLDRIAVTDHNRMDGALEAAALDPSLVIIGEEVDCADGTHLIGLCLHERIPAGLRMEEVVERIRDQGGLVYAPHPYAYLTDPGGRAQRTLSVADMVEVHNARAFLPRWNRRAADAARATGLPGVAGSDSHFGYEVGSAFTEMPSFDGPASLRAALEDARPVGIHTSMPLVHVASVGVHAIRLLSGRVPPMDTGAVAGVSPGIRQRARRSSR